VPVAWNIVNKERSNHRTFDRWHQSGCAHVSRRPYWWASWEFHVFGAREAKVLHRLHPLEDDCQPAYYSYVWTTGWAFDRNYIDLSFADDLNMLEFVVRVVYCDSKDT
jgi:hypothetical protein